MRVIDREVNAATRHAGSDGRAVPAAGVEGAIPTVGLQELAAYYESAYPHLYRQAVSIMGSTGLADDIVHEAFADTAASIAQGVEIRSLNAWMRRVIRNLSIDILARQGRERRGTQLLSDELGRVSPDSPPHVAHIRQRCKAVYEAVEELAPAQRSAFLLAELKGLDYGEIASRLNRSEHAVRQLLSRARCKIRDAVGKDVASVVMLAANVEAAARLSPLRAKAHGLREQILTKFADLRTSMASLFQRSADIVGQPVAPLATAALVVATLGAPAAGPPVPPVPAAAGPPAVAARTAPHESDHLSAGGKRFAAAGVVDEPLGGESPATSLLPAPGEKPRPSTDTGNAPLNGKRPADAKIAASPVAVPPVAGTPASGDQPGTIKPFPPPPQPLRDSCSGKLVKCGAGDNGSGPELQPMTPDTPEPITPDTPELITPDTPELITPDAPELITPDAPELITPDVSENAPPRPSSNFDDGPGVTIRR